MIAAADGMDLFGWDRAVPWPSPFAALVRVWWLYRGAGSGPRAQVRGRRQDRALPA